MFHFRIHGPRYAVLSQTIWYEISEIELPMGIGPSDVKIQWYKNNIPIDLLPEENQFKLDLYDIGYPAEGIYSARATIISTGDTSLSNSIQLEIGEEYKQCSVSIQSRSIVKAGIGDTVSFAPVCVAYPDYAHRECVWFHKGKQLGPDEYIDVKIESDSDYGEYVLQTKVWAHGGWKEADVNTYLEIIPKGDSNLVCEPKYIHDLNPARNAGFIWVGWWVIDEIIKANKDGFDWFADPMNSRFKYPCDIGNLVRGFNKWPDLEIQESRNGYILGRNDLL